MWLPIGFLWKENSSMAENSPDASGLVQPLKLTDEEIEDQTESGLIQGHTAAQWLTEDWPAFSDFQTRDAYHIWGEVPVSSFSSSRERRNSWAF